MRDVKELSLKFGRENFNCQNSLFFEFFGALFEQNGAAQTGILTNKSATKKQGVSSI